MTTDEMTTKQYAATQLTIAHDCYEEWQSLTIETPDDNDLVAAALREIKSKMKALEARRKKITVPMNTALRETNALFRPPREQLQKCEELLKLAITDYAARLDAENAAALAEFTAAETDEAAAEAAAAIQDTDMPTGVSIRYTWHAEVTDPALLDRRYLMPDARALQEYVDRHRQAGGTIPPLAGVKIVRRSIVSSRAK